MNTYIVAYNSFMDNELDQYKIKAESEVAAMIELLYQKGWEFEPGDEDSLTVEEIKSFAFDNDCLINAYRL